jgi:DnaK suppressor protein
MPTEKKPTKTEAKVSKTTVTTKTVAAKSTTVKAAKPKTTATKSTTAKAAKPKTATTKSVTAKAAKPKTSTTKSMTDQAAQQKIASEAGNEKMPEKKDTNSSARKTPKKMPSKPHPINQIPPYEIKKGEEYMNVDQRAHFVSILNAWKADLMQEVDRTKSHMQDEAANFPDPNDRASQEEEFSLELRTRDRERKLIKKIEETLETIKNEDYGYCDACGIEIGIRRLEARPTATLCIDCKTLAEIKERTG